MTTIDVSAGASTAEKVIEDVMKVEPTVAGFVAMLVPGAAPIVATVQPIVAVAAPYIERALTDIASSNGGDILSAVVELLGHLSKGLPNSGVLSPAPTTPAPASAQGSA